MTLGRTLIRLANWGLAPMRLRIESRTLETREQNRILEAVSRGDFDNPIYPVPECFHSPSFKDIISELPKYADRFATFCDKTRNDVGFEYDNGFFSSPDAEVLYTLVRKVRPPRIVEIGCGHSTKVIRQAILDGKFECRHTCIDPQPRRDILGSADQIVPCAIESCDPHEIAAELTQGDILFIDTSHELAPANDVAFIYARLLPLIRPGVLIHIHDIFLPYEYPIEWVRDLRLSWSEQYLVQVMLMVKNYWDAVWPGHYLQRTLPTFKTHFRYEQGRRAQSLWMTRKEQVL